MSNPYLTLDTYTLEFIQVYWHYARYNSFYS